MKSRIKHVKIAEKNIKRKKISIGHAEYIRLNGEEKFGGVVAKKVSISQVASLASIKLREMIQMTSKIGLNSEQKNCVICDVNAASSWGTVLKIVKMILI